MGTHHIVVRHARALDVSLQTPVKVLCPDKRCWRLHWRHLSFARLCETLCRGSLCRRAHNSFACWRPLLCELELLWRIRAELEEIRGRCMNPATRKVQIAKLRVDVLVPVLGGRCHYSTVGQCRRQICCMTVVCVSCDAGKQTMSSTSTPPRRSSRRLFFGSHSSISVASCARTPTAAKERCTPSTSAGRCRSS